MKEASKKKNNDQERLQKMVQEYKEEIIKLREKQRNHAAVEASYHTMFHNLAHKPRFQDLQQRDYVYLT